MQVAYLLYDKFTALDITGPHDVQICKSLSTAPDFHLEVAHVEGRRKPQDVDSQMSHVEARG